MKLGEVKAELRGQRHRRHAIGQFPARGVVGLAEREHREAARPQLGVTQHALVHAAVIHHVLVHLVREHQDVGVAGQRRQGVDVLRAQHRAAGVVGSVDDDQAGTGRQRVFHLLPVHVEVRQLQRNMDGLAPRQADGRVVGIIGRVEHDYFVARGHAGLDGIEQRFRGTRRYRHLLIHVCRAAVMIQHLGRDLFPQRRNARHGRVLVAAIVQIMGHTFAQRLRTIEVREALGKVDGPMLLCHSRHDCEDGCADIREFAAHGRTSSVCMPASVTRV